MASATKAAANGKPPRQNPGPACQQCRIRKLRCDRQKPCGGCVDSGVSCHTDSTPPQRGPKRGHLKVLRSRIAALEQRMVEQDPGAGLFTPAASESQFNLDDNSISDSTAPPPPPSVMENSPPEEAGIVGLPLAAPPQLPPCGFIPGQSYVGPAGLPIPALTRADLDQLFFDRVNIFLPMIQQYRYFKRSRPAPTSPSHTCLQYAMWTIASALSSQFHHLRDALYHDTLERLGHSPAEDDASRLEHAQAWIIIAVYEFMQAPFQRAWISVGRAIRLVQLMRLNEIDKVADIEVDHGVFIEKEERRRTFWMAFCLDRCSCVLEGLSLTLNEQEIYTRLPSSEDVFQSGAPVTMPFLSEVLTETDPNIMSPFAESIIFTTLWGRSFIHQRQPAAEHVFSNASRDFCERQLWLDDILTRRIQKLQQDYVAASVKVDSMLLYTSMIAQTTALLLCKAAESIPPTTPSNHDLVSRYQRRAPAAAKEIVRLAQYLPHFSFFKIHPFTPIPLFLCRQFLFVLRGHDDSLADDLNVIGDALQELKGVNGLCQSRLDIDFSEVELPDLQESPEAIMDFFGNYMAT
ncbi:fungal-specific transcription factor domain-containing protein [Hypoxylon crocopeplum]|nr:fungal-specific transcription factor domain-containing protein [Hypoxylon crocopeplum]